MSTDDKETPFSTEKEIGAAVLDELLAGVTGENLYAEVDTGRQVGKEAEAT